MINTGISALMLSLLPIHCRCRGLLLHEITLNNTQAFGTTSLGEGSALRIDLYLHNTQHLQKTEIHALSGIRVGTPNKRAAAGPSIRHGGYQDWLCHRICGGEFVSDNLLFIKQVSWNLS